uniref:Ras-associating domain-containing protein n=1 Tax=Rhodnius prolixus TaxID=13249 RepID=T1HD62_RHOPR
MLKLRNTGIGSAEDVNLQAKCISSLIRQSTIKVYARCLRSDIEYKTLGITYQTTCKEVVQSLLNKYKMRHRDPNLFYLTMEVTVRKAGIRTVIVLDEESRFSLQIRNGGLSKYKSLLISEYTSVDELIQILLNCYNSKERVEQFSVYEVCESQEYQRKLHPDDCPLQVQRSWTEGLQIHFLLRRNLDYRSRRSKYVILSSSYPAYRLHGLQIFHRYHALQDRVLPKQRLFLHTQITRIISTFESAGYYGVLCYMEYFTKV